MKQRWLKRSMVLLTMLLLCFAMATTAYAAEDAIYSEYTVTSTEELGEILRSRLAAREGYFKINYLSPLSPEEFDLRLLFDEDVYCQHTGVGNQGDYIKKHGVAFTAQAQYGTVDPETGLYLYTFKYDDIKAYTTAEQEAQVAAKIEALFEEWQIDDMPDYYKIKTIYDYICSHVTYDWDSYWSRDSTLINQYTAHAALIDGTSVCQGYANLFYRMANDAGVDTRLVTGMSYGDSHAWNLVCLDGTYYWLDSTWDADIAAGRYRDFLRGSDAFEKDHEVEGDWSAYPISKTDYIHPTAISAEIETAPGRLTYMQGDPLNTDGLTLRITYDDGYTYTATSGWDVSGFDSGVVGVQSVSVEYDWTTVTYDVTVAAGPEDWVYHGTNRGLAWTLTPQGLLTISGEGFAKSGVSLAEYPASWHNHREKITSLVIEEGITKIGAETFAFLYNLTSAVIPDSVVQIQDMAFRGCAALADIQIGENVQTIDWDCFSETAYWNDPDNWENGILYLGNYLIGTKNHLTPSDVEIREGTTAIAGHAFYLCSNMETLTIPLSMKEIGLQAFERCDALKTVFYAGSSADWRKINMKPGNHRLLQGEIVLGNPAYDFIITTDDLLKLSVTAGNRMTVSDETIAKIVSRYEENVGFYMALQPIQPGELILYENIHHREFVEDAGAYVPISFYTVQIVEGNHKLEFVSVEREATCTLPGLEKYACVFCEHEELVETELAKHTWVYDPPVKETCETDGLTLGFHCSVCQFADPAQQVIPAPGHDYGGLVLVHKPTVTGPAEYRRECRNCDAFEIRQRFVAEVWIMSQPDKREYLEGEPFDPTGLEVWVLYEGGELQEVTEYAISGYDSTPGAKTITVTCGGKTGTFMVYVNAKEVERIEITTLPNKLTYQEGEAFRVAGMVVTAYYNNGTNAVVADYTVSGYDSAIGTKTVTVTYGGKTATFQVTVTARVHDYTAVVTPPTCTAEGYTTHTCSTCGHSYVDHYVDATGHSYENGICTFCQTASPLYGKNVSILGDSISAFAGVSKCSVPFYNGSNRGVQSVYDTWWGKLIEDHAMSLCVNYSQGGVAMNNPVIYNNRVLNLHTDSASPDIIFVFLGHNDKQEQVKPFEDIRWSTIIQENGDGTYTYTAPDSFTEAYVIAVHKMLQEYPAAEIVLLQCLTSGTSEKYNRINPVIQAIGDKFGLMVVDFYENGLHRENTTYFPSDVHPNKAGMNKITDILGHVLEDMHLHRYQPTVTPPTCTEQGYTTHICACGKQYIDTYVPAAGHALGEWSVTEPATCTDPGSKQRACANCDHVETGIVPATGHSMGAWSVTKPASCTDKGSEQRKCANCTHTETRDIAAKGHNYKHVVTPPTCTAQGYTTHTCSTCSHSYKDTPVSATGHSMGSWSVTKPASCTDKGSEQRKCANCSHTETREIAAKGHSYKHVVTPPTCTAEGYTTHTCSVCSHSYKDTYVPAKGHIYSNDHDRTCNTCGATRQVDEEVLRVYGSNRFDTAFGAANLLKETLGVDKFDNVIVACGTNFADALAGSYLGKVKNAPILLVQPNMVPTVRAYIVENLKPGGTVYLLGGETIVPGGVSEGLNQFVTKRLWGANRYETNLAILEEAGVTGGEILVCTGYGFADSLSASAVGKPILLVDKRLDAKQQAFLAGLRNDRYIIVGGVGAVNEVVEESLRGYGAIERLAGANRFTTSVMVAERFFDSPTTAVVAYAANFPDGLCGGPLAAAMGGPLLLTANNDAHITAAYTEANDIRDGVVLGGPGLISDAAVRKVFAMATDAPILVN